LRTAAGSTSFATNLGTKCSSQACGRTDEPENPASPNGQSVTQDVSWIASPGVQEVRSGELPLPTRPTPWTLPLLAPARGQASTQGLCAYEAIERGPTRDRSPACSRGAAFANPSSPEGA
jgi:hypothetical protein